MAGSKPVAELDEVMLAMDVVDTIRHRELIVERELNSEERRDALQARLKSLYAAQGLDVPDRILAEGVAALEEDRFAFVPPEPGFQTRLANLYVRRSAWGKPLLAMVGLVALILVSWQLLVARPEAARIAALPSRLQASHQAVLDLASTEAARSRAGSILAGGEAALARGDEGTVATAIAQLDELRQRLDQSYELRVVSRPGELSGVWRVPEANPNARNYYLIVEAIDASGKTLSVPVRNEEDGRMIRAEKWGVRVDQETFDRIAADKKDDGIIQDFLIGTKARGRLEPDYRIETSGAGITSW